LQVARKIAPCNMAFKMLFFCLLVSQNEHFTGISVYFMDIVGDFVSMVQ
jgi:hypothetical protein